ncbi:MAG: hypothetical protein ACI4GY_00660 [Acutalibacteraceae bacterium]
MIWIILLIICVIIAAILDSFLGKIVIGAAVVAIGFLLLSWITGMSLFITLAKACAVIIVVVIAGAILLGIGRLGE